MNIVMIGTGYVGLVSGACFSEMGNTVICVDTNREKIDLLNSGSVPIYEPGLESMIRNNTEKKRLFFSDDAKEAIRNAAVVFICVGTPPLADGTADLSFVWSAAQTIGQFLEDYTVVVTKSTVPVGTTVKVGDIIREELEKRGSEATFDMVNNPEFLKEGNAITDFMKPDRVVIGRSSEKSATIMRRIYAPFFRTEPRIQFMSIPSSELTKYASNSMLATRISFMNEIARLAEKVGANIEEVRQGMAHDKRIGKYFLYAGAGYGGSCFPKDVSALIQTARKAGCEMSVIQSANEANVKQKRVLTEKIMAFFSNNINGKKIAVWEIAFKPETDDIREAPAVETVQYLRGYGAELAIHDPVALDNARSVLGTDSVTYHETAYDAVRGADALVVVTEWKEYRSPDWRLIHELMNTHAVFDGRNLYDPDELKEHGFRYFGIGFGEHI